MKGDIVFLAGLLMLPALILGSSTSSQQELLRKNKKLKKLAELKSRYRKMSMTDEEPEKYVTEEYARQLMKVERRGEYLIGFIDVPKKKSAGEKARVEYLDPRAATYDKRKERRIIRKKNAEMGGKNTFFNREIDSVSDASSVPDEHPRVRPTITEHNATYSDFIAGRGAKLICHISNEVGDFDIPEIEDGSDVLALAIKPANFYSSHNYEMDGYIASSVKEERNHVNRNEKVHPMRTYVRENEVDATVPHYSDYDVETSQKEMETHFGRERGRDNKPKIFANRNTFSSINGGCSVM